MKSRLYIIHALSPLHAGTGQSVGAIDLPIAREKPTGIPLVPGSSVKGALRARCNDDSHRITIFGPETTNASDHAGAVQFSDAHLLLLPVRSIAGTFAWVTSPFLLQRFARDAQAGGITVTLPAKQQNAPTKPNNNAAKPTNTTAKPKDPTECFTAKDAAIRMMVNNTPRVLLEDFDFAPSTDIAIETSVAKLADVIGSMIFENDERWRTTLTERLCIVHDDVMSLLLETATEVVARIRLEEETKTVAKGALWYEEALPTESVLYGLASAMDVTIKQPKDGSKRLALSAGKLLEAVEGIIPSGMLQVGGKSTVGRGMCHFRMKAGA